VLASEDIPPFSLFSITSGAASTDVPVIVKVDRIGESFTGSLLSIYTNGEQEIKEGKYGYAGHVTNDTRVFCHVSSAGEVPEVGYPCGVQPGSFDLTKEFSGMVCLSTYISRFGINGVWCTLASPDGLVALVTSTISKFTTSTKTLGTGQVRVHLRKDSASLILAPARKPTSITAVGGELEYGDGDALQYADGADLGYSSEEISYFDLPVYNLCDDIIAEDTWVTLHSFAGVGLVAIPCSLNYLTWFHATLASDLTNPTQTPINIIPGDAIGATRSTSYYTVAENRWGCMGCAGDACLCVVDEINDEVFIVLVKHKLIKPLINIDFDTTLMQIIGTRALTSVMSCDTEDISLGTLENC
jgi:hypothetical protein